MHGILKSNHQKLCDFLQDVKITQAPGVAKLNELEEELQLAFIRYQEKMVEIKRLILIYEEKQKMIRNEIRNIRKSAIIDPKR